MSFVTWVPFSASDMSVPGDNPKPVPEREEPSEPPKGCAQNVPGKAVKVGDLAHNSGDSDARNCCSMRSSPKWGGYAPSS